MIVMTKKDLMDFFINNKYLIKKYGVAKIGLFGSFVRNEQHEKSDIDLLVEFYPEKKNYDNFIGLTYFIEDTTQRKVDLITSDSLSPYIGPRILNEVEYYAF